MKVIKTSFQAKDHPGVVARFYIAHAEDLWSWLRAGEKKFGATWPKTNRAIEKFKGKTGTFPLKIDAIIIDTGLVYGQVTFNFDGKIVVDEKGWEIEGDLNSPKIDTYNFDPKKIGERELWKEIATRIFYLAELTLGKSFAITFEGVKQIKEKGAWK